MNNTSVGIVCQVTLDGFIRKFENFFAKSSDYRKVHNMEREGNVMIFKRMLAFIMVFVMVLSIGSIPALASSTVTYNSLDAIKEDLNIFKTIANGTISPVKVGNTWYYQFTRPGYSTVRIKASAFMTVPKNSNLTADNKALNSSLSSLSRQNYSRICYYYTMNSSKSVSYTTYKTSIYRFKLVAGGSNDEFTTSCDLTHGVSFTYTTKVPKTATDYGTSRKGYSSYVTPSTVQHYAAALKRSSSVPAITPTMTIKVTNTGSNNVNLSKYTVSGKGNAASNVKGLIDIAYSAYSLGKNVATQRYFSAFKTLLNLNMGKLTKTSKQYNTGKEILLSQNRRFVYQSEFTSPIRLSSGGDWTQVVTKCSAAIGNAKFSVNFSFA